MKSPATAESARDAGTQRLARASRAVCHALARGNRRASRAIALSESEWKLLADDVPRTRTPAALAGWRGRVDAIAARARYGDAPLHARLAPSGEHGRRLFDLLEQNRVEALASRQFSGMRANLAALCHERWERARPEGAIRGVGSGWIETFALLARFPLGAPLPQSALNTIETRWRSWMSPEVATHLEAMGRVLEHPENFARSSLRVIAHVIAAEDDPQPLPMSGAPEQRDGPSSVPEGTTETAQDALESKSESSVRHEVDSEDGPRTPPGSHSLDRADLPYSVYTRSFDRVSLASDLGDSATLERRRRELDRHEGARLSGVARWAHRLQRRLLALQLRSWSFDRDEGVLDAARLTRVVTHPLEPLAYKQESEIEFPDTVVSLLVDNSGSMRGASIANAAACAEILGRVLERCSVKTEILGFTTRSWQGGHARRQWVGAGRPANPGRIADLHHVIYKSADEPWRRARMQLGLMLEEDLLKENIDGEALQWAAERLQRRPEPRRILIVISDGAPLDEATLAANDPGFLDRHLRTVIRKLERGSPLEVLAIGIGHDVTTYYRRAVKLGSAEEMGEALVAQLIALLASKPQSRRQRSMHAASRARGTFERGEDR